MSYYTCAAGHLTAQRVSCMTVCSRYQCQASAKHTDTLFDSVVQLYIARTTGCALSFLSFNYLNGAGWPILLLIAFGTSISSWHDRARLPMRLKTCSSVKHMCLDDVLLQSTVGPLIIESPQAKIRVSTGVI